MTLPAFAAERRRRYRPISPVCRAHSSKPAARCCSVVVCAGLNESAAARRVFLKGLLQLRFEHDSSTIRARFEHDTNTTRYNTLRGFSCARIRDRFEHSTRISGRRVLQLRRLFVELAS